MTPGIFIQVVILILVITFVNSVGFCAKILQDPTRPLSQLYEQKTLSKAKVGAQLADKSSLILNSTFTGQRQSVAIINGKSVQVGDLINNSISVLEINPGKVILDNAGAIIEIFLLPADIKSDNN